MSNFRTTPDGKYIIVPGYPGGANIYDAQTKTLGDSWTGGLPSRRRTGTSSRRSTEAAMPVSCYGASAFCAPMSGWYSPVEQDRPQSVAVGGLGHGRTRQSVPRGIVLITSQP